MKTGRQNLPTRLALSTAVATAILGGYSGRKAYAGVCTPGVPGTYACSGAAGGGDVTQSINNASGNDTHVSTTPGFGLNAFPNTAITITHSNGGSLTFLDSNNSTITAAQFGITATNNGASNTTITSNGSVSGGFGIFA